MIFLVLASLFTGIVLFLSTVLRSTFDSLTELKYHEVYSLIIVKGRKSVLINAIVLIPLFLFIIYFILGFFDPVFVIGGAFYITGSFGASRIINEPIYNRLLDISGSRATELSKLRSRLNMGNAIRAIISIAGIALIAASLIEPFDFLT